MLKANEEVASFAYIFDSMGQVILGPSTINDEIYLLNQTNITCSSKKKCELINRYLI